MKLLKQSTRGLVGFDLGARCVKTAQVVLRDGEYRLRSAAVVPRNESRPLDDLLNGAPVSSVEELAAVAGVSGRLGGRDAAALLSMSLCELVQLDPPAAKRAGGSEISRAVQAEVHRWSCESVVDVWPVGLVPKKLNAIAAPRPWSDQVVADMGGAGWDCQFIDALPWALARATSLVDPQHATRMIAALDWGFSRATLVLINSGAPALARCLKDCAFERVLTGIEDAFRIGGHDAERLLAEQSQACRERGDAAAPAAVGEVLAGPLARLAQETRRTLSYWQNVYGDRSPDRLYLFGGGACIPGIERAIEDATGVDVQAWSIPIERSGGEQRLPPLTLVGAAAGLSAATWEAR